MTKQEELTLKEVCQVLGKSKRTVSRYIKKGLLKPELIRSNLGILDYRFKKADLESLKIPGKGKIRQETGQKVNVF